MARPADAPLVWLAGEIKTPPFSAEARVETGFLLRRLQQGETLAARGRLGCHELRIPDRGLTWRIMYHVAGGAIVILDVFAKKTEATPQMVLTTCQRRLVRYQTVTKARTRR